MGSYISELDTKRFGFKIAKVNYFDLPPAQIIHDLKIKRVKLVIARAGCEQIDLINQLEDLKFKTMDVQVTYRYDITKLVTNEILNTHDFIIREAILNDNEELTRIASESFNQYGHYFADKKLDKAKCLEIYQDWIQRSLVDKEVADVIFIAQKENEIAGFLSFKIMNGASSYAFGVQGAVAQKFRNQNIFRGLAKHGLIWGAGLKLQYEEHNVLLTNYPVNRSFIKIGFVPFKSFFTMHCWLD